MPEKYLPQRGDRVRVVLEGDVESVGSISEFYMGQWIYTDKETIRSIEKIEPPVTEFGPGDVVRRKDDPSKWYAIGEDGWLICGPGWLLEYTYIKRSPKGEFTSDDCELVTPA